MNRFFLAARHALCSATAALASFAATASVVTVEFAGTVGFTGWDTSGVFGPPNTDLFGAPFSATFSFDLAVGSHAVGLHTEELVGGPQVNLPMPLLSGSIEINGITAPYTLDGWAYLLVQDSGSPRRDLQVVVEFYTPPLRDDVFNVVINSPDIAPSFSASYQTSDVMGGGIFRMRTDAPSQASFSTFAEGQLTVNKVTFLNDGIPLEPNAVSEPSPWMLLGGAMALLGLRKRPPARETRAV